MDEPDWAKILRYLHNRNGELRVTAPDLAPEDADHEDHERELYDKLRRELSLKGDSDEEITDTHEHLQNTGLVNYQTRSDHAKILLTTDGFEVAHERELSRRGNRINHSLVFFTFVLVLAQIVGVIPLDDTTKTLWGFALLAGMGIVIWWTDMFEV